jgi:hypothetical protein
MSGAPSGGRPADAAFDGKTLVVPSLHPAAQDIDLGKTRSL